MTDQPYESHVADVTETIVRANDEFLFEEQVEKAGTQSGYVKFIGCYFGLVEEDSIFALSEPCVIFLMTVVMLCFVHNPLLYEDYIHEWEYT